MHPVEEYQDIITLTVDGLNECEIVTLAGRRVGAELLYNSVHRKFNQLELRCGRENQHPAEWNPKAPGWAAQENRKETWLWPMINMLQFCSVSNSLSNTTLSIKWEVYFSKELCRSSLLCCRYDSVCICIVWLYNTSFFFLYISKSAVQLVCLNNSSHVIWEKVGNTEREIGIRFFLYVFTK